ncbi:MAG: hypothetical protein JWP31_126 [Aeromicrobium sp.]|nr:hypothetical protein [Aeromicrobium sp.]
MSAHDRKRHEYELRLAREEAAASPRDPDRTDDVERAARSARAQHQTQWANLQVEQAMRRGDFDQLPGAGKPIPGIDRPHDPDWWIKRLVEREKISVLPPALALRKEDARLDDVLDRETTAEGVCRVVDDFNARIIDARRQLQGGPPVITPLRDRDLEVVAWSQRRTDRIAQQKQRLAEIRAAEAAASPPAWWRRLLQRLRGLSHRH